MDESQQVISRLLLELDEKSDVINEMKEDMAILRGLMEKMHKENNSLSSTNFDLTSRILELEQKMMESVGNVSILSYEFLDV